MIGASKIITHAKSVLQQKKRLLDMISAHDYVKKLPEYYNSSIGEHVRHSTQHYQKLITDDVATYDQRIRHNDIETNHGSAKKAIGHIESYIDDISPNEMSKPLTVEFMADSTGTSYQIESTVARELSFVAHHAVHHLSIMSLMMRDMGYETDASIGLANSTQKDKNEKNDEM